MKSTTTEAINAELNFSKFDKSTVAQNHSKWQREDQIQWPFHQTKNALVFLVPTNKVEGNLRGLKQKSKELQDERVSELTHEIQPGGGESMLVAYNNS